VRVSEIQWKFSGTVTSESPSVTSAFWILKLRFVVTEFVSIVVLSSSLPGCWDSSTSKTFPLCFRRKSGRWTTQPPADEEVRLVPQTSTIVSNLHYRETLGHFLKWVPKRSFLWGPFVLHFVVSWRLWLISSLLSPFARRSVAKKNCKLRRYFTLLFLTVLCILNACCFVVAFTFSERTLWGQWMMIMMLRSIQGCWNIVC